MASLSEKAYEQLKELVIKAEPGTFFSVRKCAEDLELSYTPTREALLQLHSEGMLRLVPKVGFFTVRMDMRDITDIYQSRDCVERYVIPLVITHLTVQNKQFLWHKIKQQEEALEKLDFTSYSKVDSEFHCYLIGLLNNQRLLEFYQNIRSQYRAASNGVVVEHSKIPIEEHKEFMELIEKEKYDEAAEVMYQHTKNAIKRMQEGFVRIGI